MNPHIKYRQLRAFSLVARLGSFKGAANAMAITQSSLSALIRELEEDLNSELFVRTTRSCRLSEAGEAFLEEILGPLDALEGAYSHAQKLGSGNRGKLELAALSSLCSGVLVGELAQFQREHPGVRIRLTESTHEGVVEAVREGRAELGIGSMPGRADDLVFQPLFADRLMLISPSKHPCSKAPADWPTLDKFPYILMLSGFTQRALAAVGVVARPAFEVSQTSTALAMVRNGMGVTVLPSSILPNFNTKDLTCRPIASELALRPLGAIRRATSRQTQAAKQFEDMLLRASKLAHFKDLSRPTAKVG